MPETIDAIDPNGSVTVNSRDGRAVLPASYVSQHVDLAYAETVHAAQGRTVDHSLFLADGPVDAAGAYVALTRGRHSNHTYTATDGTETGIDVLERAIAQVRTARPAIEIDQATGRSADVREPDSPGVAIGL